ncbi:hypothetical protein B0H11DRAFT_2157843 [Mycena galericulata]|nr:hypothetical protein B0H11DRAFT_2157843 [Mycena galericulata]
MSRRLYLGRLSADARSEDVSKLFEGYGSIIDCRVMTGSSNRNGPPEDGLNKPATGFGFVEFENAKDAEDAVTNFNGKSFMGQNIVVEFAKESRPRRDPYDGERSHGAPRSRRPPGIRLIVSGISRDTSWQDLKDFGREAGSVSFADIDRDFRDQGILEYLSREDADRAVKDLDGKDLRGRPRAGPDNYHRSDRRDDRPPRDDRYERSSSYRDDRGSYRDDRGSYRDDRSYRRDRSRSPPRRSDYEDRRPARSPPPPRREADDRRPAGYDDYRRGGYDDRRGPDSYYDRRRDREDKRRDEKEDRFDDRPPRNGDAGWSR